MKYFLKLFFVFLLYWIFSQAYSSFQIVEVFPNTIDDKNLEYIVIKNTSTGSLSLSWFILGDKSKEYIIQDDESISPDETRLFWRPETKLILNNSNEEVFLKTSTGYVVDYISYESSNKWEVLYFTDIWDTRDENTISQEVKIISDETDVFIDEEILLQSPWIIYDFQIPSYISDSLNWVHVCDTQRDECKVNFDLRESFSDSLPEREYECEIDFGIWELTGQELKCNPNTVIFPEGIFEMTMKIFHEDDRSIFSETSIFIHNISEELSYPSLETWQGSVVESSVQNMVYRLPEISFELQQPSYVEYVEEDTFVCDTSRNECRVNLDFRSSFDEDFRESDYVCEIDFWLWYGTGEEQKCNPNTITIPEWESEMSVKISHEDDPLNFIYKNYRFINDPHVIWETAGIWGSSILSQEVSVEEQENSIYIFPIKIEVQSGLEWEGRYFYCEKEECKINLNYEKQHSDERCLWNFSDMEQSSSSTHTRCNPWYITVTEGVHDMSLRVYEKDNEDNKKIMDFYVYNEVIDIQTLSWDLSQLSPQEELNLESEVINIEIQVQWKISKEKMLSWSLLECRDVKRCYVNLEWIVEWDYEWEYIWKLNGEVFSEKMNPTWIWVEWVWEHEIVFQAWNRQEDFTVMIYDEDIFSYSEEENQGWGIQLETKNAKIRFTQNYLVLKYDGLRISWVAPQNSQASLYTGEKYIASISTWEEGKYRFVSKDFSIWEHSFRTVISSSDWEVLLDKITGTKIINSEDRLYWFQIKKSSTSSSQSSYTPKLASLQFKKPSSQNNLDWEQELSLKAKILLYGIIFLSFLFWSGHFLSVSSRSLFTSLVDIYSLRFNTKQKIALIL